MPPLAVTRKGIYANGLDEKKEDRCCFGLLSLRAGIITHATISVLLLAATGLTTTREELLTSDLADIFNIYIPIPFMDRGITSLTLYHTVTPFIGAYGTYKRSYRAIKVSKFISHGDIAWVIGVLTHAGIVILKYVPFILTEDYLVGLATRPDPPTGWLLTCFKYWGVLYASTTVAITALEIYVLCVKCRYEKMLAPVEEKKEDAYCGCIFCKLYY